MKTKTSVLFAALLAALPLVSTRFVSAQAMPEIGPISEKARNLYRTGHYDDAIRLYKQMAKLAPDDINVLKQVMWAFWNMGHYSEAADVARAVQALNASDVEARNILAWAPKPVNQEEEGEIRKRAIAAYQAGRYDESTQLYRNLADREPDNIDLMKEFMWSLWNVDRFEEATGVATRILQLDPDVVEAKDVLKRAPTQISRQKLAALEADAAKSNEAEDWATAAGLYRQIADQDPKNSVVLTSLVWALYRAGQLEEAKTAAMKMTELRPNDAASWNLLAKMQVATSQQDVAIESYKRSLSINPRQAPIDIQLGRYYTIERRFKEAIPPLEEALRENPELRDIYPLLGKNYFFTDQFEKSYDTWKRAVQLYPDEVEFQFNEAQSLYFMGQHEKALAMMKHLADRYRNQHALLFLVDDAIAQNNINYAESVIESFYPTYEQKDENWAMKLAALYQQDHKDRALAQLLDRFLAVWPDHQPSLLMKGSLLYDQDKYSESLKVYTHLYKINPYSVVAMQGMGACEQALGHSAAALHWAQELRKLDPTDPLYVLAEAQAVYENGDRPGGEAILKNWLSKYRGRKMVPVILYHALTPFPRDPVLAYPYHYSVAIFESHMRALHEAGYNPVTAEEVNAWVRGKGSLPDRPVLIAFDDDRRDSFVYADPILEKYNLKATMFIPVVNVEGHRPPAFLSWDEIKTYMNNGRWEIQAHGDFAHINIVASPEGGKGLFLVNKQFLPDQNRMETDEEWAARIEKDYADNRDKIYKHLGVTPTAFALPEGLYGQEGNSNTPLASPTNLKLLAKYYSSAYTQDKYGINVQGKDPARMTRVIPTNTWTGAELLKHFRDKNPVVLMDLQLLDWATWDAHTHEAFRDLAMLKKDDATPQLVLAKESEIRFSVGDLAGGRALAERATAIDHTTIEDEKLLDNYSPKSNIELEPTGMYQEDNAHRRSWNAGASLSFPTWHNFNWRALYNYGNYAEPGFPDVHDNSAGLGTDIRLGLYHRFSAEVVGHAISGKGDNALTGSGNWQARWTDHFTTSIEGGRDLYLYAHALQDNIASTYEQAVIRWNERSSWQFLARGRHSNLTDRNARNFGQAIIGRSLVQTGNLRLLYRFTFDEMDHISPDYYSPKALKEHQGGPEISIPLGRHSVAFAQYLVGYGKENGSSGQLVHDLETYVKWALAQELFLTPTFEYERTPTYWDTIYSIGLRYVF